MSLKNNSNIDGEISIFQRKSTIMTENETVDIVIRVIDLLEILHSKGIIHTNINPGEIFFKNIRDLDSLWFNSLYHCSWDSKKLLKKKIEKTEENLSLFDLRLRRKEYLCPEQIALGEQFDSILKEHESFSGNLTQQNKTTDKRSQDNSGKIDLERPELFDFYTQAK